jgi:hypothetical protein
MGKMFGGAETGRRTHIRFHFFFEGSSGEQQGITRGMNLSCLAQDGQDVLFESTTTGR